MFFKSKLEKEIESLEDKIKRDNEKQNVVCEEQKEPEEWIWVEGYKGTDADMSCTYTNYYNSYRTQYSFDGYTECNPEEIEECFYGFHFCKELKDVFGYYSIGNGHRYFTVKALVKKSDWEKSKEKYVSCKLKLIEEVGYLDIKKHIPYQYMVENENDYKFMGSDFSNYIRYKYIQKLVASGYSNTFSIILVDEKISYEYIMKAVALKEEGVSPDMCAYLLLKD